MPRLVGMKEALTGILAGKLYAAKPALRAKLVNEVCHPEHLLTKAIAAAKKKKRSSKARSWIPNAVLFNVAKKNVVKKTNGNYPAPLKIIEVLKESIKVSPKESFEMEQDAFIELCFKGAEVPDLTAEEIKEYIRYIADRRLLGLGMKKIFGSEQNHLPWLD